MYNLNEKRGGDRERETRISILPREVYEHQEDEIIKLPKRNKKNPVIFKGTPAD